MEITMDAKTEAIMKDRIKNSTVKVFNYRRLRMYVKMIHRNDNIHAWSDMSGKYPILVMLDVTMNRMTRIKIYDEPDGFRGAMLQYLWLKSIDGKQPHVKTGRPKNLPCMTKKETQRETGWGPSTGQTMRCRDGSRKINRAWDVRERGQRDLVRKVSMCLDHAIGEYLKDEHFNNRTEVRSIHCGK